MPEHRTSNIERRTSNGWFTFDIRCWSFGAGRSSVFFLWSLLLALAAPLQAAEKNEIWILVDTASSTAQVMRGDEAIRTFEGIAVGKAGAAPLHVKGDSSTPLGEFRITRIDPKSRYRLFIGLDYPTPDHVKQALELGVIDQETGDRILSETRRRGAPPQNTALGGYLGLHGLGGADPKIHRKFNWTQGCIALTNRQIDELSRWVKIGTRVVVR